MEVGFISINQMQKPGARHGFCAVFDAQLAKNGIEMRFDRAERDHQAHGNLLV